MSKKDLSVYYKDAYGTPLNIGDKVIYVFKGACGRIGAHKGVVSAFEGTCILVTGTWPGSVNDTTWKDRVKSVSLVKAEW